MRPKLFKKLLDALSEYQKLVVEGRNSIVLKSKAEISVVFREFSFEGFYLGFGEIRLVEGVDQGVVQVQDQV